MAEYRRFVAYVYEYQKGRKGGGCGFVRVEAWEKRCRMEIHVKCPGLIPGALCSIYGFTRNRGHMEGWLLGNCRTEEGHSDCIVETDRRSLGGQVVRLEQLSGMIITMDNGGFFGTEWDDQPIHPEAFRVARTEDALPEQGDSNKSIVERTAPAEEDGREETAGEKAVSAEEESQEGSGGEKAVSLEEDRKETAEEKNALPEKRGKNGNPVKMEEMQAETEAVENELTAQSVEETEHTQSAEETEEKPETETPDETQEAKTSWEPFSDGELTGCRKISLQDVGRLGRRSCVLRNNRFLQHGFYQFGHLLVCRNCRGQRILGVPGGYDRQEQYMANMFGFPYFKPSREIQIPGGKGGYWYRFMAVDERGR